MSSLICTEGCSRHDGRGATEARHKVAPTRPPPHIFPPPNHPPPANLRPPYSITHPLPPCIYVHICAVVLTKFWTVRPDYWQRFSLPALRSCRFLLVYGWGESQMCIDKCFLSIRCLKYFFTWNSSTLTLGQALRFPNLSLILICQRELVVPFLAAQSVSH